MACTAKAAILLLLAALICSTHAGNAQRSCQRSDIYVTQVLTGKVDGKTEFRVTIDNKCSCPQADVVVRCAGISSVVNVDRTKIRPLNGDLCSVANGEPIPSRSPVIFTYAGNNPVYFKAVSAKPGGD